MRRIEAIGMLLLAVFFWGYSFPLIRAMLLLEARLEPGAPIGLTTASVLAARFLIALLFLLLWQLRPNRDAGRSGGWTRSEIRQGILLGIFAGAGMLLQTDGLHYTDASTSAFLTQAYVILIPLWVSLRSRQPPNLGEILSCVLVLAGVAVLGKFDWRNLRFGRGEMETLLSSLFFMVQVLSLENKAFAGNRAGRITLVMFAVLALAYSALAMAVAPSPRLLLLPCRSKVWLGYAVMLAGFCTIGGFLLMNAWQPEISATEAGLVYCFEPVFASIFALFTPALLSRPAGIAYPNEGLTPTLLLGGALITVANLLLHLRKPAADLPVHGPQA